jgi:peroxiredoxin
MVVIGVALDNTDKTRPFSRKYNVDYPVVYGRRDAVHLGKDLGNDQGAIPFTVVIDRNGKIVEVIKGDTPDGKLESALRPLVG